MENGQDEGVLTPLQQEYRVQVLDYPAEDPTDGYAAALAFVVLSRPGGALLALPQDFLPAEDITAGLTAAAEARLGQSTHLMVAAGLVEDLGATEQPEPSEDAVVPVLLIDVNEEVLEMLRPFVESEQQMDVLHTFDPVVTHMMPLAQPLAMAAWSWVQDPASGERGTFYSATEDMHDATEERPRVARPKAKAKAQPGITGGGQKKGKPTVASLAASMEHLSTTLPMVMQQLESLNQRTQSVEAQLNVAGNKTAFLQQPLGALAPVTAMPQSQAGLVREVPPPKFAASRIAKAAPANTFGRQMAEELEQERLEGEGSSASLTLAVLEKSKALSTLVSQIANGEVMADCSSSSTGFSSRGAAGRVKLQQELSLQRGTFFSSVFAQMARRMQPARSAEATPLELITRGVTATAYLERYGGFGRCRDLGHLAWQVAMIMDHLQSDNIMAAAKDSLALMMVCLEQASLDGGRLQ